MTSRVRQAEDSWRRDAAIVWGLPIRLGVRSDLVEVKQSIRDQKYEEPAGASPLLTGGPEWLSCESGSVGRCGAGCGPRPYGDLTSPPP